MAGVLDSSIFPGFHGIDNCLKLDEGVHTQIKRAYELSVCFVRRFLQNPDYHVGGRAW
jgi:hypothetical protein